MKTMPSFKCYHCEDCLCELLAFGGHIPTCDCGKEMVRGGVTKEAKVLNPIKASKRSKR